MRKLIALALVAVAVMAVPAFASVQNVKVSGNLDMAYVNRQDFNMGVAAQQNYDQSFFMSAARLRVDADLTDNVSTTIGLINERAWGDAGVSGSDTKVDVNLAYVKLREMLYSPLTVTVGRQTFNYGNSFIVGTGGPNNGTYTGSNLASVAGDLTRLTAYDGAKLVFDYNPLTIDVIGVKVNSNNLKGTGDNKDDVDLSGINANYKLGDAFDTVVEGYFFAKIDQSVRDALGDKKDTVYVPGLRASTNPITGLNVQGELAWQKGTKAVGGAGDNIQRDAMGAQFITSYQLPFEGTKKYAPVVSAAYTYVSGDSNPADAYANGQASSNKWTAWDPMFEDQSAGKIYNSIFNLTNCNIVELAASAKPLEDVTAKVTYTKLWLDKEIDTSGVGLGTTSFLTPDGTGFTPTITSNRDLGAEIDGDLTYAYTEDVSFGLSMGVFFPGDVFDSANDKAAKQAIASVGVAF